MPIVAIDTRNCDISMGTGSLTGNIILSSDPSSALQAATKQYVDNRIPRGVIVMWSGAETAIPNGWLLCNGTNSTPDLRNRFIVGAGTGGTYTVTDTGGSNTITLTTAQLPSHTHSFSATTGNGGSHMHQFGTGSGGAGAAADTVPTGFNSTYSTKYTNTVADHTHNVSGTTGGSGSGTSITITPYYYALCYIMKT